MSLDARRIWAPRFILPGLSRATTARAQLAARGFLFIYTFAVSLADRAITTTPGLDGAYLTLWGVWLVVAYTLLAFSASLVAHLHPAVGACADPHAAPLPPRARAAWAALITATRVTFSLAVTLQLVVVVVYWVLLATPKPTTLLAWSNVESHGVKLAIVYLDLVASAMRLPDAHVVAIAVLVFTYICMNATVSLTRGAVYSIITWRSSGEAGTIAGIILFIFGAFYFAALVAALRDRAAARGRARLAALADEAHPATFLDDPAPLPCGCCCRRRESAAPTEEPGGAKAAVAASAAADAPL